ncbi:S8 family peptidase [uncultured Methanomethylovorans sp.]|uniref:S8 family peptidase n=1 Tax=uncultured Methanomethylovorans sp. TaxID=183759 RepID=UPI002AA689BF|nr:S8 family peptidase [uncultured Methanomethylovorans sp.]
MNLNLRNKILVLITIYSILMLLVPISATPQEDVNSGDILEKDAGIQKSEKYVPEEILVKFKSGFSDKDVDNINSKNEVSVLSTSPYAGFKTLKVPKSKTVEEMVEIYSKNPNVEYAVPNYVMYATMVPNDPLYVYQWNFKPSNGINVTDAWDISTGKDVIVAVIDTGVASNAPDLSDTNFVQGYDFVNLDNDPTDDNGHGTHVTGTIAQSTNNGIGVAGVAYGCTIMPVKVLDASGSGTLSQLVDGIYYASGKNNQYQADVISMSLGFPPSVTAKNLRPLFSALDYAYSKGIVIVAAAGNNAVSTVCYPAAYEKCIAVGATRYDGTRSYYSNYGSALDIMAPGGDMSIDQSGDRQPDGILQNTLGSSPGTFDYYLYQGTSMATPHVSGVAALLIANGVKGPENVRQAMQSSAKDMGATGWDSGYGWGIVDAYKALTYYSAPELTGEVSIGDVEVTYSTTPVGKNKIITAKVIVTIVDTNNMGVKGATVSGEWSGATTDSDSGVTDSSGKVTLYSNEMEVLKANTATFTFTVKDVSYTVPWDGNQASGTITYAK